jgi:molybdenum cofactor guanylyltransferase
VAAAGIVLAGGRSSRMGSPKAALEWHGSTLLRRVTSVLARSVDGPVVVVRAPGQALPELPAAIEVVEDPREGLGPLQGLAAGLVAVADRAPVAFLSATDVPFLHPAFVRRVLEALDDDADVALPDAAGHPQPLAAAYRTALAPLVAGLVAEDRLRPAFLFERCRVRRLEESYLRGDPVLAAMDPELTSLLNLNDPGDYAAARGRGAPPVTVERGGSGARSVQAATLAEAAAAAGVELDERVVAELNGERIAGDAELALVAGDTVTFSAADARG